MADATGSRTGTGPAPRYLTTLLEAGTTAGLTDGQLLDRFLDRRDDSAEAAFAALLERHGGMVRRVCREILENSHDADDAFQAVFLILARDAGSIRRRGSAGPWLHGVALRVARCARSNAARRRRHERRRGAMIPPSVDGGGMNPLDPAVGRALHEEIGRLADKHRSAVVLCYLEGLTHEMAALQLGWPVGTVRSRLAWARDRLRARLTRRGIAPSLLPAGLAHIGEAVLSSAPAAKVPISSALTETTLRAAMRIGAGDPALAGIVSAPVAALVEEGLRMMFWTKLRLMAATTLAAGAITTGAGVAAYSYRPADEGGDQGAAPAQAAPAQEPRNESKAEERLMEPEDAQAQLSIYCLGLVRELIQEYNGKVAEREKVRQALHPEQKNYVVGRPDIDLAMYTGALLIQAELVPGTPAAEEAMVWIVGHNYLGSSMEHALAGLASDHATSGKLGDLPYDRLEKLWGSRAAEDFLRRVSAKNPDPTTRGRATYALARLLTMQASNSRRDRLLTPDQVRRKSGPFARESWGRDYPGRIMAKDPGDLDREAERLLRRVVAEKDFAEVPFVRSGSRHLPEQPSTLGGAAKIQLDAIGAPARRVSEPGASATGDSAGR